MIFKSLVLFVGGLALAAPAANRVQPAVQPGGDIPKDFHPVRLPSVARPVSDRHSVAVPAAALQYVRREAMVPMRDGVRLFTVMILPKGSGPFPLVLDRTPYSAAAATGGTNPGATPESILTPSYAELVRHGFVIVVQDVRGKYRSQGEYVMTRPLNGPLNPTGVDHSTDAYDTIDWLVKNVPESNGRVATIGTSYGGFTSLMSLVNPHPALKAAVPMNPMADAWKGDDWFHNGAFRQEMISYVYLQTASKSSDLPWLAGAADDYETFLRYGSASAYGHAMGMDQLPFWRRLAEHPSYDDYWQQQALDKILGSRALTVPTLVVAGEWDQEDMYGPLAVFAALKTNDAGNAHLVLGPWYHGEENGFARTIGPIDLGSDTGKWFRDKVMIPFLDEHLKAGPQANIARVTAFEVGPDRWERLADWPPACAHGCPAALTPLYLAPGKRLSFDAPRGGSFDFYVSDPASPVPYRQRPDLWISSPASTWPLWLEDDQRFAAARKDVLSYQTEPLTTPVTLKGTPQVHLVASTSGTDSDWVVKLIDVFPASMPARPLVASYQFPIAMEVFRGRYRTDPAHPRPLTPNRPLTYDFALPSVDYVVEPGHRLMVQIQSSWFPLYDRNPQSFVPNIFFARASDYRAATQKVFTGPQGTWIGLPVAH